jgi:hypothetical protein
MAARAGSWSQVESAFAAAVTETLARVEGDPRSRARWRRLAGQEDLEPLARHLTLRRLFRRLRAESEAAQGLCPAPAAPRSPELSTALQACRIRGTLDARRLGTLYERLLDTAPEAHRKRSGSYYTPDVVVRYLLDRSLGALIRGDFPPGGRPLRAEEILRLKVLDPAMGAGYFLVAALDLLCEAYQAARGRETGTTTVEPGLRRRIAERCLFGVDRDPIAVELARLSLRLAVADASWSPTVMACNLRCGDALAAGFAWDREFPEAGAGFDIVIGNPPYVDHRRLNPAQKTALRDRFPELGPAFDLFTTFHALALELTAPSGLHAFIVPNRVVVGEYAEPLRRRLLSERRLIEISDLSRCEDLFNGVSVYPVIPVISGSPGPEEYRVRFLRPAGSAIEVREEIQVATGDALALPGTRLYLNAHPEAVPFVRRLVERFPPLEQRFVVHRGLETGDNARHLRRDAPVAAPRIVTNEDVAAGTLHWRGSRLAEADALERAGKLRGWQIEAFDRPKVVLKKVCWNLTAALDEEGFYLLNTCYGIWPREGESLRVLERLLNGQVLHAFTHCLLGAGNLRGGYLEPTVAFLRALPLPDAAFEPGAEEQPELALFEFTAAEAAWLERWAAATPDGVE